ncbi:MAG: HEAT repeat domain-containing protein [Endomicrobia bacterium]|nr:HEAT repeat domain-containing protein [Endomicrobiia bacterium]
MKKKFVWFVWSVLLVVFIFVNIMSQTTGNEQTSTQVGVDAFTQAVNDITNKDPYIRRQAAEQMGNLRDPRAVPYLRKLLKDENVFVRQTAVDSLGLLRTREVVDDLLNVIMTDKEPQVRQSAVVALGYIGMADTKVITVLMDTLRKEESSAVKYAICNTFSILRSTIPIPSLVSLLSSEDINLQRASIYALGKISHPDSILALRNAIDKNIENEAVIIDIIKILIDIGDTTSLEKFKLLYSTPTTSEKVKIYSAFGLAKLGKDVSVLPKVKKMLQSKDENIKNFAIDAVRFIGDRETLGILKQMQKTETAAYTRQLIDISIKQLEAKFSPTKTSTPSQKKK